MSFRNLLESMKQPVGMKKESKGLIPTKKPRDLPPLDLGTPLPGENPTLEIKRNNRTIVDWMNGHAKMKTRIGAVEKAQNLLREWWGRGMCLRQRTANWVTHIFREHKEDDLWAGNGGGVQKNGWTPPALRGERLLVSVVSGMEALTTANAGEALSSWPSSQLARMVLPFYKKCGPVPGNSSMGAGRLLTISNNGWTSARAESVQLFNAIEE